MRMANYTDDFSVLMPSQEICDEAVRTFLNILGVPIAMENTEWVTTKKNQFLRIVLDGVCKILMIPEKKRLLVH